MPIPIIRKGVEEGLSSIPYAYTVIRIVPWVLLVAALKYWFGGARNRSERLMHSKVVMITVFSLAISLNEPERPEKILIIEIGWHIRHRRISSS